LENQSFTIETLLANWIEHNKEYIDFKSLSTLKWDEGKKAEYVLKTVHKHGLSVIATETKPLMSSHHYYWSYPLQKEANTS
jgi:DNA topoisomerase-3